MRDLRDEIRANAREFADLHHLTQKQARVLELVALGYTLAETCVLLGLEREAAKSQAWEIHRKVGTDGVDSLRRCVVSGEHA